MTHVDVRTGVPHQLSRILQAPAGLKLPSGWLWVGEFSAGWSRTSLQAPAQASEVRDTTNHHEVTRYGLVSHTSPAIPELEVGWCLEAGVAQPEASGARELRRGKRSAASMQTEFSTMLLARLGTLGRVIGRATGIRMQVWRCQLNVARIGERSSLEEIFSRPSQNEEHFNRFEAIPRECRGHAVSCDILEGRPFEVFWMLLEALRARSRTRKLKPRIRKLEAACSETVRETGTVDSANREP